MAGICFRLVGKSEKAESVSKTRRGLLSTYNKSWCAVMVSKGTDKYQNRQCTYTHWGSFSFPLLPWEGSKYFVFRVCVCVRVCMRARACVCVALVIQYTVCMLRILSCVACPAVSCFYTHLINGTIFGKMLLSMKCVLIFCTTFVWNISRSKQNSVWHHKFAKVFIKMPVILIRL